LKICVVATVDEILFRNLLLLLSLFHHFSKFLAWIM